MPYTIRHNAHTEDYEIVRESDGKVVGTSDSHDKAERSIGYRLESEARKAQAIEDGM